mmetsp:Transcript_17249/g.39659  ORF Transcript_17249/g.39659 Transcript_17249/m.39659 type:complete len:211 (-) Transcript_17249:808-1440(-)
MDGHQSLGSIHRDQSTVPDKVTNHLERKTGRDCHRFDPNPARIHHVAFVRMPRHHRAPPQPIAGDCGTRLRTRVAKTFELLDKAILRSQIRQAAAGTARHGQSPGTADSGSCGLCRIQEEWSGRGLVGHDPGMRRTVEHCRTSQYRGGNSDRTKTTCCLVGSGHRRRINGFARGTVGQPCYRWGAEIDPCRTTDPERRVQHEFAHCQWPR